MPQKPDEILAKLREAIIMRVEDAHELATSVYPPRSAHKLAEVSRELVALARSLDILEQDHL